MTKEKVARIVGYNIVVERTVRGHLQVWLANRLGVTRSAVSQYENGRRLPTLDVLVRIAEALGCPLVALLRGLVAEEVAAC